ncbi:MAG: GntR family transcriptional regulator [Pseudomonadota bacterium]
MRPGEKIVPIRDQIADQLRSDIIAGELAPGTKLNEQGLATRFGVSRGPIRDVLLQLTKEGLLVTRSNVGASVSEMLSPELQSLMVDIRRRIESHAAKQLKGQMTDEDFEALDYILDQFQTAFETRDFTAVTKADIEFHKYLVEKAGGQELVNLWYPVVLRMRMNYKRIDSPEDGVDEHRAIVDALRADDTRKVTAALKANIR